MAIKRFKLDDGREGVMGTMDNGMVELVFDDGTSVILAGNPHSDRDRARQSKGAAPSPSETAYPLVSLAELPGVVRALREGCGHPRYAVFMFEPQDSTDGDFVNLQYSVENGVLGLDWVLLGGRNRHDQQIIRAHAMAHGHQFEARETNGVPYLRLEGQGLCDLGKSLMEGIYHLCPEDQVQLLAEGFQYPARPSQPGSGR